MRSIYCSGRATVADEFISSESSCEKTAFPLFSALIFPQCPHQNKFVTTSRYAMGKDKADECKDYLEHCDVVKCDHADFVDFARANCARTCNFCFANSTLPPEYACTDLLDDCNERMKMCRDIDFIDIMAVFCPRLCSLCTYKPSDGQCQELVPE
ncbi:unnamed protein product [Angiostrongylus costaricensis]|uniref:ShKT domain-containing protein n=1 Tax=Angiostrongylus costaricensis TaxID=334426 RepID=A0A0R3PDS8_ANGCS|nr:unnamed protein product [Angiostrongylus costaricensis]